MKGVLQENKRNLGDNLNPRGTIDAGVENDGGKYIFSLQNNFVLNTFYGNNSVTLYSTP